MHILMVEDEPRLGRLLRRSLQANRHLVADEMGEFRREP
jgi:DNA-binding response OmpR family regulator